MSQVSVFVKGSIIDLYGQPATPASPPTGQARMFYNSATDTFEVIDSNGKILLSGNGPNGVYYANQFSGNDIGAQINTAVATIGSGNTGVIIVPPGDWNATTLITIGKSQILIIQGSGTFTCVGIRFSDSLTDYSGTGALWCPENATIKLADGANVDLISQTNFSALTGSNNAFGLSRVFVKGCTLDGNKANNSSGNGVSLYGRMFTLEDITEHDAAQVGIVVEGHDAASFSIWEDDDVSFITRCKWLQNGGDGVNFLNNQSWVMCDGSIWGNGGWGITTSSPVSILNINMFLNSSGACWVKTGGQVTGDNVGFTTASPNGRALLIDSGVGACIFSGCAYANNSGYAIEVKSQSQKIDGSVENSTTALLLNGAAATGCIFTLSIFNNKNHVEFANSAGGDHFILMHGSAASSPVMFVGAPSASTYFITILGQNPYIGFDTRILNAAGWAPELPQSNAVLPAIDVAQTWTATQKFNSILLPTGSPTSGATAGTAGKMVWDGTNLYLCTVTGVAGAATWTKLALVSD